MGHRVFLVKSEVFGRSLSSPHQFPHIQVQLLAITSVQRARGMDGMEEFCFSFCLVSQFSQHLLILDIYGLK